MLWDDLCPKEYPSPKTDVPGMVWANSLLSPWEYGKSFGSSSYGLLPELRIFDPLNNALGECDDNKSDSLKVIKTSPVLFPPENEGLPKGSTEPNHKDVMLDRIQRLFPVMHQS